MQPSKLITLTTDFGLEDGYVAMMKGVILGICPNAQCIDYTHAIGPQNVIQAAYQLRTGYRYFPPGTVHVVVVDPGVGSGRRAIALETPDGLFVAPDNGLLSLVWYDSLERWGAERLSAVELNEPRFWLDQVSSTFHGRDIFAPVAAHLASGVQLSELGAPIPSIVLLDRIEAQPGRPGELLGRIIHVDHFGNCVTNVRLDELRAVGLDQQLTALMIDQEVSGLYRTYADGTMGTPIALINSNGYLEIAVKNGHAAQLMGVAVGDPLRVYR